MSYAGSRAVTDRHTHTHKQTDYGNPRAHAPSVNYEECSLSLSLSLSLLSPLSHIQPSPLNLKVNWDIYLFEQGFGEAEAKRVLVEDGARHEGAHIVQQLLVFLQHKPWQGRGEILGENGARLKTAGDRNKERRQVWWGREYLTYLGITLHILVS